MAIHELLDALRAVDEHGPLDRLRKELQDFEDRLRKLDAAALTREDNELRRFAEGAPVDAEHAAPADAIQVAVLNYSTLWLGKAAEAHGVTCFSLADLVPRRSRRPMQHVDFVREVFCPFLIRHSWGAVASAVQESFFWGMTRWLEEAEADNPLTDVSPVQLPDSDVFFGALRVWMVADSRLRGTAGRPVAGGLAWELDPLLASLARSPHFKEVMNRLPGAAGRALEATAPPRPDRMSMSSVLGIWLMTRVKALGRRTYVGHLARHGFLGVVIWTLVALIPLGVALLIQNHYNHKRTDLTAVVAAPGPDGCE